MTSEALLTVSEYLETSIEDGDPEYVDGELIENNAGEIDHSKIQTLIATWFMARQKLLGVYPLAEVRTRP